MEDVQGDNDRCVRGRLWKKAASVGEREDRRGDKRKPEEQKGLSAAFSTASNKSYTVTLLPWLYITPLDYQGFGNETRGLGFMYTYSGNVVVCSNAELL